MSSGLPATRGSVFPENPMIYPTKSFWVIENSAPVLETLNKINARGSAHNIATVDFSTLYTAIPQSTLCEVMDDILEFVFKHQNHRHCRTRGKVV